MSAVDASPAPAVECDDCGKDLTTARAAHCDACFDAAVEHDVQEGLSAIEDDRPDIGEAVRDWAANQLLLGRISRETKELFDLCADDIEVGHG